VPKGAPEAVDDMPLWDKARHIARTIYGAEDIIADKKVRDQFAQLQKDGHGAYPICMAKRCNPVTWFAPYSGRRFRSR
jgi:formyltetrahydrofolate synthetase